MVIRVGGVEAQLLGPAPGPPSVRPPVDGEDQRAQAHDWDATRPTDARPVRRHRSRRLRRWVRPYRLRLVPPRADDPGRVAHGDHVPGEVPGHDRARSDNRVRPDGDAGKHDDAPAEPY